MIPQPFIDELLNRCDIVELIDSHIPLKKRGNSYLACCPFHNEKTPSFNVMAKKQFYHCFGCGVSGNAISFHMQYLNQNFIEAVEALAARVGMQVPSEKKNEPTEQALSLYQTLEKVNHFYQNNLKNNVTAINYLKNRGLNGLIAKKYQLGYAPSGWHILEKNLTTYHNELIASGMLIRKDDGGTYDRYRHRIMFPIHDRRGRIIGFGGRSIDPDQQPKYLNSPETAIFQKGHELYGLYQAIQTEKKPPFIVVVEGYLDVISLAQYGVPNVVAALGTAISSYHIQLLSKYTRNIVFCFDGDRAGQEAAWRALENSLPHLHDDLEVKFALLPDGHDPDSFIRKEGQESFLNYVNQSNSLSEFFIKKMSHGINLQQLAGKNQFMLAVKPHFLRIPNGPFRQLMLNELSRLIHIENHRIEDIMQINTEQKPNSHQQTVIATRIQRTPSRLVISILLQNPELYQNCHELLNDVELDNEEQEILPQLIYKISQNPKITTAMLIETWREHACFERLNTLAFWDHQIPEEKLDHELIDILNLLKKQGLEKKINLYIAKSRKQGLTDPERLFLQNLLKKRHLEDI